MHRRVGILSFLVLSTFLLSGATAPQTCNTSNEQIGPSKGEVIGVAVAAIAVVAIGTVVLVEVHKSHHTIKGCVTTGPSGLQVTDLDDHHVYDVSGVTANVKVGDQVRLRGDKQKKVKGAPTQSFTIAKMSKDYGPCKAIPAQTGAVAPTPTP